MNLQSTPSKVTEATTDLAQSHDTRVRRSLYFSPTKLHKVQLIANVLHRPQNAYTDDSAAIRNSGTKCNFLYTHQAGASKTVALEMAIKIRLEDLYERNNDGFDEMLKNYLIRKYEEIERIPFPYTGPATFYELCRIVSHVTHELFADAVNFSGVLDEFCSLGVCDKAFGAVRRWEDVEEGLTSGAGIPPFSPEVIEDIVLNCERRARGIKPYCRFYILHSSFGKKRTLAYAEENDWACRWNCYHNETTYVDLSTSEGTVWRWQFLGIQKLAPGCSNCGCYLDERFISSNSSSTNWRRIMFCGVGLRHRRIIFSY